MIHFPVLRTKRFTLQMREITIAQSIALAKMPAGQAETTAFLRYAVESYEGKNPDPAFWTIQERTLALCHYLAATNESGADFPVGERGRFSDYFDGSFDTEEVRPVEVGEVGGDAWTMFDLTGRDAEIIETLQGELVNASGQPVDGRAFWIIGAMAAQLRRKGEGKKDDLSSGEYETFLFDRMKVFNAFPTSDFLTLMNMFLKERGKLMHYFDFDFLDDGIVFLPKEAVAEKNLPPARFPVDSCFGKRAFEIFGLYL